MAIGLGSSHFRASIGLAHVPWVRGVGRLACNVAATHPLGTVSAELVGGHCSVAGSAQAANVVVVVGPTPCDWDGVVWHGRRGDDPPLGT